MMSLMKIRMIRSIPMIAGLVLLAAACKPSATQPDSAKQLEQATAGARPTTATLTFSELPVPPKPEVTEALINQGKSVYAQNCLACHGVKGDGKGDAAAFLAPKPRNFVEANFRLRSTAPGHLPTDVDLFRSVSLGMPG